jgi:hypothetical protein
MEQMVQVVLQVQVVNQLMVLQALVVVHLQTNQIIL